MVGSLPAFEVLPCNLTHHTNNLPGRFAFGWPRNHSARITPLTPPPPTYLPISSLHLTAPPPHHPSALVRIDRPGPSEGR